MTSAVLGPRYSVKYYRDGMYKLIRFKNPLLPRSLEKRQDRGEAVPDGKLSQAISRAKSVIFQVAVCNDWDFFFTGTIDRTKYDRYHLKAYYTAFTQWIRDYRKKYGCDLKYLFVPELHEDGAWHIHGFVCGIPSDRLRRFIPGLEPQDLVDAGHLNWPDYQQKFGFCSLAVPRDLEAISHYITKYITKDLGSHVVDYGGHLYRCSVGLARAVHEGYIYQSYVVLDSYLEHDGMFCSTGWVRGVDWSFWMQYIPVDGELSPLEAPEDVPVLMSNVDVEQLIIAGWCNGSTPGSEPGDAGPTPAPATK